jgi:hypothetical protein
MNASSKAVQAPKKEEEVGTRFDGWFYLATAGWWLLIGLVMVMAAFDDTLLDHERMLKWPDAVLEISTKNLLFTAGVFHLVLGVILCVIPDLMTKGLLVLWGGSVCAIYRLSFSWLAARWIQPGAPCPFVQLTADKIGIKPGIFGLSWGLILSGLALGVCLQWFSEWRRRQRMKDAEFMEHWRETREDKGRFP